MSARDRLRDYFIANVGEKIHTSRLRKVAKVSEYARRIRELRDEEGMQIKTHHDRADLKPGEYILETLTLVPALARGIPPQLRMEILERNGFTCQICGATAGDPDPTKRNRRVRLHVDHIIPKSQGGKSEPDNLRVLCSACNQAKSNVRTVSEDALNLLARINKAPRSVKKEIYEKLKAFFES